MAKVISATNKKDGYWKGNSYTVSWCVGNLIELANPEKYDEKYRFTDFPCAIFISSDSFYEETVSDIKISRKMPDIDDLIEAIDA